jgi:hypothetical protein
MPRGGPRLGAGRKRGSVSRKTTEIAQHAAANGITPLEYMLKVMRDSKKPLGVRMDAAKASAPFMHPRLSAIELNLKDVDDADLFDAAR